MTILAPRRSPADGPHGVPVIQAVADPAYAELKVTPFGVRGALDFSTSVENLFCSVCYNHGMNAIKIFEKMEGVPGLTLSDVHVRLWRDRWLDAENKHGVENVMLYIDGAWRQASVCMPRDATRAMPDGPVIANIMRIKLGDSLMWVVPGACLMYEM
jgi:hypothetical protein